MECEHPSNENVHKDTDMSKNSKWMWVWGVKKNQTERRLQSSKKNVIIPFIDRILDAFETPSTLSECSSCDNLCPGRFCIFTLCICTVNSLKTISCLRASDRGRQKAMISLIRSRNWMTKNIPDKTLTNSQKFFLEFGNVFISLLLCWYLSRIYFYVYSKRFHLTRNTNYHFQCSRIAIGCELRRTFQHFSHTNHGWNGKIE